MAELTLGPGLWAFSALDPLIKSLTVPPTGYHSRLLYAT